MTGPVDLPSVQPVSSAPHHHFFGYYDKSPWDASGDFLLAGDVDFCDREPTGRDVLTLGLVDLEEGCAFRPFAESRAWCWQPGCQMQWLGTDPGRLVIYNDRRGGRFISVVHDVLSGEERELPRAVLAVSHDGKRALSVNMSRLGDMRPGYGYPGLADPNVMDAAPDDDGIWLMDIGTGESRLLLTYAQIAGAAPLPEMQGKKHWLNHLEFNPSDKRFTIIHRWAEADEEGRQASGWGNQFFSANVDGTGLHYFDLDGLVSHYDWRDDETILAWAKPKGAERCYALLTDRTQDYEVVGEGVLDRDGHCSYSPDRRWILTDTYPDEESMRTLILYHPETGRRVDIGRFFSPPELKGPIRCDLHPRWSRDAKQVCIDSAHEGTRQMYVIDAGQIVEQQ